jgi:putative ATP-binding cassette transporter
MMTPLENILNALPNLGRGGVALRKVEALGITLTTHATEPDVVVPTSPKTSWERLGLVNVTHSYHREGEEGGFSLGPIDLTFQPGELVFLIGGNGGGKTTLALLLTGLCVPEGGEIRLNGHPVTDANREHYREHFSVVFSDFYLFESLLGLDPSKLDTQARDYLIQLQLNHKVRVEQGVFSTLDLSQGQRKRLALLTAYLEDRPFYVFDEWAADQDPLFKKIFYTQLLPELKARGKTVLVITHDDAYFCVADRCIKLEDGKLRHEWPRDAKSHARA